jgi:hypothetical protein
MRDLQCDPQTLAGPIDERVVRNLKGLDPAFVEHMKTCHGGQPRIGSFKVGNKRGNIGLFLTLLDDKSELQPPFRPHFDFTDLDERVVNSIPFLTEVEHFTSRALFGGLLPFAALQAGMCLDQAYVHLLCFDRRLHHKHPPVVMWDAHRASDAYLKWENLPLKKRFGDDDRILNVRWHDFVIPLSDNYVSFVESLAAIEK